MKFDAVWERIKEATGLKNFVDLASEVSVQQSAISKRRKRGEFPAEWVFILSKKYKFSSDWAWFGAKPESTTSKHDQTNKAQGITQETPTTEKATAPPKTAAQGQDITDTVNIQALMNMTAEVLVSDTVYRPALAANIKAFHRSIALEHDNQDFRIRIERMEQRQEMERISFEQRMTAMEEKLAQATAAPPPKVANG